MNDKLILIIDDTNNENNIPNNMMMNDITLSVDKDYLSKSLTARFISTNKD